MPALTARLPMLPTAPSTVPAICSSLLFVTMPATLTTAPTTAMAAKAWETVTAAMTATAPDIIALR